MGDRLVLVLAKVRRFRLAPGVRADRMGLVAHRLGENSAPPCAPLARPLALIKSQAVSSRTISFIRLSIAWVPMRRCPSSIPTQRLLAE